MKINLLALLAFSLLQIMSQTVLAQDVDSVRAQKWYLKNELQTFRLGSSYFNWDSFPVTNKHDVDIPTQALNLKKVVKIGILDSVDMQHPMMAKYFLPDPTPDAKATVIKELLHGTHTTGVMTSIFDQLQIQNGKSESFFKLLPLQILDSKPDFDLQAELKRLLKIAISEKIDVLSTSFIWSKLVHDEEISYLLKVLNEQGTIVVSAAGNSHSNVSIYYPCMEQDTICVGGSNYNGEFALYFENKYEIGSNYGPEIDMLAPATGIFSYKSLPAYDFSPAQAGAMMKFASGTSDSQPMVAAQIAIIKSMYPHSTAKDIKARLFLSTKNYAGLPNQLFNGITTSQFYGMSITDSLAPTTVEAIEKSNQIPVYIVRQVEKLHIDANGAITVPFKLECLDPRGCLSTKVKIRFWQSSVQLSPNRIIPLDLTWGIEDTLWVNQPYQLSLTEENLIKYEIQIGHKNLSKTIRGTYSIQRDSSAHHAVSIPIDNQVGRKRIPGLRRLNVSSPYYESEINRYSMYVSKTDTGTRVSILSFANNEVVTT